MVWYTWTPWAQRIKIWLVRDLAESLTLKQRNQERILQELADRLDRLESVLCLSGRVSSYSSVGTRRGEWKAPRSNVPDTRSRRCSPGTETILRRGVRVVLADYAWKELGMQDPSVVTDQYIDQCVRGPFCRHCLRSLVFINEKQEKQVRVQCQYCLLTWQADPLSSTIPLRQFKRSLYEALATEFRRTGAVEPSEA